MPEKSTTAPVSTLELDEMVKRVSISSELILVLIECGHITTDGPSRSLRFHPDTATYVEAHRRAYLELAVYELLRVWKRDATHRSWVNPTEVAAFFGVSRTEVQRVIRSRNTKLRLRKSDLWRALAAGSETTQESLLEIEQRLLSVRKVLNKALPKSVRLVVRTRDRDCCRYCGEPQVAPIQIDHVVPRSRGGTNHPSNLVVACISCNSHKGVRLPHEASMVILPIGAVASYVESGLTKWQIETPPTSYERVVIASL